MKVIKQTANLTTAEVYRLTKSPAAQKMKDAEGRTISVNAFCMYEDNNTKDGATQTVLSILTADGEVFSTNSPTFIRDFDDMMEFFTQEGETVSAITVRGGESKNGRHFISCDYAG